MKPFKLLVPAVLFASVANAAVWDRPAGAYTPTNNSLNITKYQTDSASHVAISSVKLDGDINKAFQGLNDIEARVPPTVSGQSGKFLTNNGATASWGLILPSSISTTGITSGWVPKANGTSVSFGLLGVDSFPDYGVSGTFSSAMFTVNSAGQIISATRAINISVTNLYASGSLVVSGTALISGTLNVSGTMNVVSLSAPNVIKASARFSGTTAGAFTPSTTTNLSSFTKTGTCTYQFAIAAGTFTGTPMCTGAGREPTGNTQTLYPVVDCTTISCTVAANTKNNGCSDLASAMVQCFGQ